MEIYDINNCHLILQLGACNKRLTPGAVSRYVLLRAQQQTKVYLFEQIKRAAASTRWTQDADEQFEWVIER